MNQHSQSGFLDSRVLLIVLVCAAACSILGGTLLAFLRPDTPAKVSQSTLTFADRVAYQHAIEEVYWRHRIWPNAHPDPKPSLDTVMPQAPLEKKVEDYLHKSHALEDYLQRPISAEELQAEMERMARHTKQPDVLRELFAALGDDPFVVAECLARPALTERLIADLSTQAKTSDARPAQTKELRSMSLARTFGNVAYTLPKISQGEPPCTDDTWTATSTTNAPTARAGHTAVWTGSEMVVWGGFGVPPPSYFDTGGRYNPITDNWTATTTTNAPSARVSHTAVWTGSEMIIWGGGTGAPTVSNTGGRYNPVSDSWIVTSTINAPAAREYHTAVWTGTEMIVFGGWDGTTYFNTGGRYNPSIESWTATNTTNAPAGRSDHTAVWTGSEMIVWGGYFFDGNQHWLNTGGRYAPGTDSWTPTSTINAPTGRRRHTAVWTGSEMVVWGGYDGNSDVNTGGRYDPSTDSWTTTSTTNAPPARDFHTAIWTSSEMIVWSGCPNCNYGSDGRYEAESALAPTPTPSEPPPTATPTATPTVPPVPGTGGRYDPVANTWTPTNTADAPIARAGHTAVWTGSQMVIWGGSGLTDGSLNTGGRYCAQFAAPTPTPTATPTPTLTPRPTPVARVRPTPAPRP
jgi:N-acetylneuraminic acid mutarotase